MNKSQAWLIGAAVLGLLFAVLVWALSGKPDRAVEVSLDAGVKIQDVKVGTGVEAEDGSLVEVHYTMTLPDGKVVLNTRANGRSHRFIVGDGTVIPGMDEAVRGMRTGGERIVSVPPHSGYGKMGYAGIVPPETTITFDIEMLRVSRGGASVAAWEGGR